MTGTIVERDGKLYVSYSTTEYSNPVKVTMLWLIVRTTGNQYSADRPTAGDTCTSQHDGNWHCQSGNGSIRRTGSVYTGPGDTKAIFVERVEVPPPKVRKGVQTRWECGEWQKLTRKGWETV